MPGPRRGSFWIIVAPPDPAVGPRAASCLMPAAHMAEAPHSLPAREEQNTHAEKHSVQRVTMAWGGRRIRVRGMAVASTLTSTFTAAVRDYNCYCCDYYCLFLMSVFIMVLPIVKMNIIWYYHQY